MGDMAGVSAVDREGSRQSVRMTENTRKTFTIGELLEAWTPYGVELLLHDPDGPGECMVRRGELVTVGEYAESVVDHLRRWLDDVRHDEQLGISRLRLNKREGDRCVEIARDTTSAVGEVAANHVHLGSPVMFGSPILFGTGAQAEAAPPIPFPGEPPWNPPVTVGILDTGLDPHPWFAERPWFEAAPEILDADDESGQDRMAGHGTFVAGVVLQQAPGVAIRSRSVLSSLGFTDDIKVASGLRALRRGGHADVVLLTAGCYTPEDVCPAVLRAELAHHHESVVVAAAGNHGRSRPFWPAALPTVLGVAATDSAGKPAEFSNVGPWVDTAASGVDVVSSHVRLGRAGSRDYGLARWSGTSFAAPVVAAAAASAFRDGHDSVKAEEIARRYYSFGR